MADFLQLPDRRYSVIYADPPWAYRQCGATEKSRGNAAKHYQTMTTAEICAMPVPSICAEGAACFMWATFPNIGEAIKVMEAWEFTYKTAAFVWVKKNARSGGNYMGLGEIVSKRYAKGRFYGIIEQKGTKGRKWDGIYFRDRQESVLDKQLGRCNR